MSNTRVKKRIVFDNIIFSLQSAGGVSNYWFNLLHRFKFFNAINVKYFQSNNRNIFSLVLENSTSKESIFPVQILRYLPFLVVLSRGVIFHSSYYRVSLQKSVLNITTVHDFTYEYFSCGLKQKIHTWQKYFAIRRSSGIICVSENTKKDLIKFVPGIDQSRIQVVYNGVGEEFLPVDDFGSDFGFEELVDKNFILFVGDRSLYKNFDKAVDTVKQFPGFCLVIVGGKEFSDQEEEILADLKERYYRFEGVSGKALNWLYNHAFCLLYPSSYEGFGIPVLEAMRAGCPVVSTNLSSIPEVAGDAALLVDTPDVDLFVEKVNLLKDDEIRENLREKGFVQASKFSWDKCFEETLAFYEVIWDREFGDKC